MIYKLILISLTVSSICSNIISQVNIISGNLIKIKFDQPSFSTADTIGNWELRVNKYYNQYSYYYRHFKSTSNEYFLKRERFISYNPLAMSQEYWILSNNDGKNERVFTRTAGLEYWDILEPFMIENTNVVTIANGSWLINGVFGNSFITNEDSIYKYPSYNPFPESNGLFRSIIGYNDEKAFTVFYDYSEFDNYKTYLIDISDTLLIDINKCERIYFSNSIVPIKIEHIKNNLYLIQAYEYSSLNLYLLDGNYFYFIKKIFYDFPITWTFRDNKLFVKEYREIFYFDYNYSDTSFINKRIILDNNNEDKFSVDAKFRYAVNIVDDSLYIFDIDNFQILNSYDLKLLKNPSLPIIDSPFVYIHQETHFIDEVEKNDNQKVMDYKISIYPNPFNPVTHIKYYIPNSDLVTLKVYDFLGKLVTTLVSKFQPAGNYEVQFNGNNLSSGIYICYFESGNYYKCNKFILLK